MGLTGPHREGALLGKRCDTHRLTTLGEMLPGLQARGCGAPVFFGTGGPHGPGWPMRGRTCARIWSGDIAPTRVAAIVPSAPMNQWAGIP